MNMEQVYKQALAKLLDVIVCSDDDEYFINAEANPIVDRCQAILDGKETNFDDLDLEGMSKDYKLGYEMGLKGMVEDSKVDMNDYTDEEWEAQVFDGNEFSDNDMFWEGYNKGFDKFKDKTQQHG